VAFDKTLTVNATIQGTNGLIADGLGKVTLANNNSYTGDTTISFGTLEIGNGGITGTLGNGNVTNNSTLAFNRGDEDDSFVVTNHISGSGSVVQKGSGKTILTADNSYSGGTTIDNGILQVGDGGPTGSLGSGNITNNSELVTNSALMWKSVNLIRGAGNFTQAGSNTVTFTANNRYTAPPRSIPTAPSNSATAAAAGRSVPATLLTTVC